MSEDVIERVDDLVRKNNQKYKSNKLIYSRLDDTKVISTGYEIILKIIKILTNKII